MASKLHPKIREMRAVAERGTVGFESGGMPKRMIGTKANNMDDYKSRFETMGLASGSGPSRHCSQQSLQSKAAAFAEKALALGEAAGLGGARVPLVKDAGATMERMLDKFVNKRVQQAEMKVPKKRKSEDKSDKKKRKSKSKKKKKSKHKSKKAKHKKKKKDKKSKGKAKRSSSSSSSSESSSSGAAKDGDKAVASENAAKKRKLEEGSTSSESQSS